MVQVSKPCRRFDFFFSVNSTASPVPTRNSANGYRKYSREVNQPGRKTNLSPPSSAEVKNEWSCTTFSPYAFLRDRNNFVLLTTHIKGFGICRKLTDVWNNIISYCTPVTSELTFETLNLIKLLLRDLQTLYHKCMEP